MTLRTFSAVLHKEDSPYVAECPEVGAVSHEETVDEALNNLREATELYLEASCVCIVNWQSVRCVGF